MTDPEPEPKPAPPSTVSPTAGRRNRWGVLAMWLAGLVLALAVVIAVVPKLLSAARTVPHRPLAEVLTQPPAGWVATPEPLANTPEARQTVAGILQYDDAVFVHYTRPTGTSVDIYAAYWGPGKAPYSLVGVHTPDTCWINNGWRCVGRTHRSAYRFQGRTLEPVEQGVYTFDRAETHVMFWHLVGGKPHDDYGLEGWVGGAKGYVERLPLLFRDLRRYSLNLAQDQVFVRISSTTPIDDLLGERDFQELLLTLEPLGVFEPKGSS